MITFSLNNLHVASTSAQMRILLGELDSLQSGALRYSKVMGSKYNIVEGLLSANSDLGIYINRRVRAAELLSKDLAAAQKGVKNNPPYRFERDPQVRAATLYEKISDTLGPEQDHQLVSFVEAARDIRIPGFRAGEYARRIAALLGISRLTHNDIVILRILKEWEESTYISSRTDIDVGFEYKKTLSEELGSRPARETHLTARISAYVLGYHLPRCRLLIQAHNLGKNAKTNLGMVERDIGRANAAHLYLQVGVVPDILIPARDWTKHLLQELDVVKAGLIGELTGDSTLPERDIVVNKRWPMWSSQEVLPFVRKEANKTSKLLQRARRNIEVSFAGKPDSKDLRTELEKVISTFELAGQVTVETLERISQIELAAVKLDLDLEKACEYNLDFVPMSLVRAPKVLKELREKDGKKTELFAQLKRFAKGKF